MDSRIMEQGQPAEPIGLCRKKALIVFDLDGTISDSRELARVCYKRVFALMGYGEISDELADSFNGPDADEVCRVMGIGPDRRPLYNQLVNDVSAELTRTIGHMFPGTKEMLSALYPKAVLSILTNGTHAYCDACIESFGIEAYIHLRSGFVSGVSKAQRMREWAKKIGASQIICVGDRCTDIANAREAGAVAVGVTYGMGSREEMKDADVLCDSPAEAARVIAGLLDAAK